MDYECGYCGGRVIFDDDQNTYVHADSAERIPESQISLGDFVSARHNRAGSEVLAVDLVVMPVDFDREP